MENQNPLFALKYMDTQKTTIKIMVTNINNKKNNNT